MANAYGLEVGWDQQKQMATIWNGCGTSNTPDVSANPTTNTKPDYSNWTAEEEAKYQKSKPMWEFE